MTHTVKTFKETPVKQRDIQPCVRCGRGVMHDQNVMFYRVRVSSMNMNAVRRQHGLEMLIGSPRIAAAMGTDEDMAQPVGDGFEMSVCLECAMDASLDELFETAEEELRGE